MSDEHKETVYHIPRNVLGSGAFHIRFLSGIIQDGFKLRNIGEAILYAVCAGFVWHQLNGFFGIPGVVAGSTFIALVLIPAFIFLKGIYGGKSVLFMFSLYLRNTGEEQEMFRLRLPGMTDSPPKGEMPKDAEKAVSE
jgi:hypothetical protein